MNILSSIILISFVSLAYSNECPDRSTCASGKLDCLHFVYIKKMINFVESKQIQLVVSCEVVNMGVVHYHKRCVVQTVNIAVHMQVNVMYKMVHAPNQSVSFTNIKPNTK